MTADEAATLRRLHNAAVNAQVEFHDACQDETASEDEQDEALEDSKAAEAAFNRWLESLVDAPVGPPTDKPVEDEIEF